MAIEDLRDVASEAGAVATLIQHPEYIFFCEQLLPEHFTSEINSQIYKAVYLLTKRDVLTIDVYNIVTALKNDGNETVNMHDIVEFMDNCSLVARSSAEEYRLLANNVLDMAMRRDLLRKLQSCETVCLNTKEKDVQQRIYGQIDDVMMSYCSVDETPLYKDIVDEMWNQIVARQHAEKAGFEFKFPRLNDYVTIERGELVLFGAQEKQGKSMMLLNCAVDLLRKGASVLYIDSELSTESFTIRLLSHLTGIEFRRIKYGKYDDYELEKIKEAIAEMKTWSFVHKNVPIFDAKAIYTITKRANHIQKIDVLIVDYFKMNKEDADAFTTYMNGGAMIDMVKNQLASDMNIAALGAVQLTAKGYVADSAKIARNTSTLVIMQDKTEEEIANDGVECGNKKLNVYRNRNGEQMRASEYIDLNFDGNRIMFTQAKQHEIVEPV